MQFQLESISLPGLLQANYIFSSRGLQSCWVFTTWAFPLIYLRQKNHQLHTSFVVTYAIPLGILQPPRIYSPLPSCNVPVTNHYEISFFTWGKLVGQVLKTKGEMGAKRNNFQCFFAQKLKLHFLHRLFFYINSTFLCVEFMNSGSLLPLKVCVDEKGVSDLFQHTQKRDRKI